ncbi:MAG: UDP-2,3-diacylglucosamine diphosphatase LpxI [Puniceicoccales bacterium]|nr:UDP-2,3-diacylglucosamine diphosphatase LpxI [Puniceicoccales bacterium]
MLELPNLPEKSRIAIIAGRGEYPILCAKNMLAAGHTPLVIAVDDDVDRDWFSAFPRDAAVKISVEQIGKLLSALKNFGVQFAIMAGQVRPKKLFHRRMPDGKALRLLAGLKERNAESIFGAIEVEIAKIGVKLLDARSFMESELATCGPISCKKLTINGESLNFGIRIAKEIARLNIGQSVVVRKGTVIAVEDFAGTDELITRAKKFNLKDAIFVKAAKPNQNFRFDVPVFGMQTLENLQLAQIKYAALEANSVLILNKQAVVVAAKKYGIEMLGFSF